MANWSNIDIEISGTPKQITTTLLYLDNHINDNYITYNSKEMTIDFFKLDIPDTTQTLYIQGEGRWSGPSDLFMNIVELFDCYVDYKEKESGSNFTTWIKGSGSNINYREDAYYSQLYIDMYGLEAFKEEVANWICEYKLLSNLSIFRLLRTNGMSKLDIRDWLTNK